MFDRLAASTAACLFIAACGGAASAAVADSALPAEVVVKLRSTADLQGVLATHQLRSIGTIGARPIYRLSLVGNVDLNARLAALRADARVLLAEPNVRVSAPEARQASLWAVGSPGAYTAQWAPRSLALAQAHQFSTGAGMRVAVLGSGIDARHPAFGGRLLPGRDFVDGDNDPSEGGESGQAGYGHGTHVAGLVALTAPSARIMPLRVLDANGLSNTWLVAKALLHAVDPDGLPATDDGAHIVSLSLGTTRPTGLIDVVIEMITCSDYDEDEDDDDDDYSDPGYNADKARCNTRGGALVIAAAGNGASASERQFPAAEAARGALAVAATNADSRLASFNNSGSWIQIGAPGEGITSAVPGGGWGVWSGTSMAAPITAGVAALVWSRNPSWKPVDVTQRITERSATLCGTSLRRVDAAAAVADFVPPATVCP